jgi:hypothetical protein
MADHDDGVGDPSAHFLRCAAEHHREQRGVHGRREQQSYGNRGRHER